MDKTTKKPEEQEPKPTPAEQETKYCGIVMPIAPMLPQYEASHWTRVKAILERAIEKAGFVPRLVSDADEIGVIHGRIVQNLYDDQIVVCDVSGRNPNVMFELGMRLAFDKPTIIVKDEDTSYSFDTQVIEHIPYRKDLRYDDVEQFSERLTAMIANTVEKKQKDPDFSPFLGHFAKRMKPKKLESEEISGIEFVVEKLSLLEARMASFSSYLLDPELQEKRLSKPYTVRLNSDLMDNALQLRSSSRVKRHDLDLFLKEYILNSKKEISSLNNGQIKSILYRRAREVGINLDREEFERYLDLFVANGGNI